MQNIPEYRVRELASFFKAMTGRDCMEVDSATIFHYMCVIGSPFAFKVKFRYKVLSFLKHPIDVFIGHFKTGQSLLSNEFKEHI